MKTRFIFHILLVTIVVFIASCVKEGPAGLDGADGADGADGSVTCLACHSGTSILTVQFQYAASVHRAGVNVAYAGGRSYCAECHSSEGFIEFQTTGTVASNISMPTAINCETCHKIHTSFDYSNYALRTDAAVTMNFDGTTVVDLGDGSNLCINCHQARTQEPNMASPGEETFEITSPYYGPHHGPQANIFAGIGFAEIEGPIDYPIQGTSKHLEEASCIVCHMGEYVNKEGGHTWNPSLESCQTCHATTSFDYGGVQFETEEKLIELRDLLVQFGVVEGDDEHGYHPVVGTFPMVQVQAFFNWVGIEEDRSLGVHNPQYIKALLSNSIQALKDTPFYDNTKLNAMKVSAVPTVDGEIDALWADVPSLHVALGETNNPPNDPSQVGNCTACHAFDSDVSVTVKAVYTDTEIFFLTEWPDPTASMTRGNSWNWNGTIWSRTDHESQSEDRMSFFWPIGNITGAPYSTGGCMTKCHMYYPTDTDPHVSTHAIVDDAWLTGGRADMWHSKGARGAAFLTASGAGLTIDPATFEVTAGTFAVTGYADDKYVDVWLDDTQNGEDGGRYGDAGTSGYSHNRIGDKSRPKWIEKAPVDYADAMTLLQSEIDAGECAGDATTGVSDADAALYYANYSALTAVIPERILRQPEGSRGDIRFGAVWNNGVWTAEFSRKLVTGNDDDIQFDNLTIDYLFDIAQFDNSRHGYEHRTSRNQYLKFIQ